MAVNKGNTTMWGRSRVGGECIGEGAQHFRVGDLRVVDEQFLLGLADKRGENVSTEDLRLALHRYRSFFGRLLLV